MDKFLLKALEMAKKSRSEGGIPIGSILIKDDRIIGMGHNRRIQNDDPTAHAEIECLRNAGRIGSYKGTILYSTLMPCHLCAGAVVQFGIKRVVAGESKSFAGASEFMIEHGVKVIDLNDEECYELMQEYIRDNPDVWNEDIGLI